jgi:phosphoribosylformylglycinamidine synthase
MERLERNRQVIFRYVDASGAQTAAANPNGALNNVAGICNEERNVVGLMPHPERACELALGSADGLVLFKSVVQAISEAAALTATTPMKAVARSR